MLLKKSWKLEDSPLLAEEVGDRGTCLRYFSNNDGTGKDMEIFAE